jgi:hypothetical protein
MCMLWVSIYLYIYISIYVCMRGVMRGRKVVLAKEMLLKT